MTTSTRNNDHSQTILTTVCCILFAFAGAATLAGCNTIEGAGEDVEATGDAIEDAADDN